MNHLRWACPHCLRIPAEEQILAVPAENSPDRYQVACTCGVRGPLANRPRAALLAWNSLVWKLHAPRPDSQR